MVWQLSEAAVGVPQPSRTDGRGDSECIQYLLEFQNTTVSVKTFSPPPHSWCFSYLFVLDRSRRLCPLLFKRCLENHVSQVPLGGI